MAKSVHDAGWSSFVSMLEYKTVKHGRELVRIGRFEPTSQVCSTCGVKDGPKPVHVREWTCTECGTLHDRDINAAINIKKAAGPAVTARGAQARPVLVPAQRATPTPVGKKQEPTRSIQPTDRVQAGTPGL
jgi:putative transposase